MSVSTPSSSMWYFAREKKKLGPFSWDELRGRAVSGELKPEDMVLQDGSARWTAAQEIAGLCVTTAEPSLAATLLPAPETVAPDIGHETPPTQAWSGDGTAPAALLPDAPSAPPGYELLVELGRGGMGVVYKARQLGLNRLVALKMILGGGFASSAMRERFRAEGEAVARVQHPNIVQIHEVGEHQGQPFFSLEFCSGGALDRKLAGMPLPPREAAQLLVGLARAVHFAHERGIVHRDLKPANVLLSDDKQQGAVPKIADFGLAKDLDVAGQTHSGAVVGTPSYMSPEQAAGRTREIGPPTDIYALGAILYECLTGRPPFRAAALVETLRLVQEAEPVAPRTLQPNTPLDLDTICLKCLQKEPARRYLTALALAEDLERFHAGEPIRARPVGAFERGLKWVRRKPAIAGLIAAVLLLLIGGVTGITLALLEANRERDKAITAEGLAKKNLETANVETENAQHTLAIKTIRSVHDAIARFNVLDARLQLEEIPEVKRSWEWHYLRRRSEGSLFTLFGHESRVNGLAFSPDGELLAASSAKRVLVWSVRTGRVMRSWVYNTANIDDVAFSPDGRVLAISGKSAFTPIIFREIANGRELPGLGEMKGAESIAFSPDGKYFAAGEAAAPHEQARLLVWEWATRRLCFAVPAHRERVHRVRYHPEGKLLYTSGLDGLARAWVAETGKEVFVIRKHETSGTTPRPLQALAVSPDGRRLLTGDIFGNVAIWESRTGTPISSGIVARSMISDLAFRPDGEMIAAASYDGKLYVRDELPDALWRNLAGHTDQVMRVAFAPDGRLLASAGADGAVKIWDGRTSHRPLLVETPGEPTRVVDSRPQEPYCRLAGPREKISDIACSPDGRYVVAAVNAGELWVWDAKQLSVKTRLRFPGRSGLAVAFSNDGAWLAAGGLDSGIHLWSVAEWTYLRALGPRTATISALAFQPKGAMLAAAFWGNEGASSSVAILDPHSGSIKHSWEISEGIPMRVVFRPDGQHLACPNRDVVRRWDVTTGEALPVLTTGESGAADVAYNADGTSMAVSTLEKSVQLWDLRENKLLGACRGHESAVSRVLFTPDDRRVISSALDLTTRVWDVRTREHLLTLEHSDINPRGLVVHPDGKRLLVGGTNLVAVWETDHAWERQTLRGHQAPVDALAVSPDGNFLVSADRQGELFIWETDSGRIRHRFTFKGRAINTPHFTRDGKYVVINERDDKDIYWDLTTGERYVGSPPGLRQDIVPTDPQGHWIAKTEGPLVRLVSLEAPDEEERARRLHVTKSDMAWHGSLVNIGKRDGRWFAVAFHHERYVRLNHPWDGQAWRVVAGSWRRAEQPARAATAYLHAAFLGSPLVP